jgi:hypothetical protein
MTETTAAYRMLSSAILVSSAAFATLTPDQQNEISRRATRAHPLRFVENFDQFSNRNEIIAKFIKGDDVSLDLEFHGIELAQAEKAALTAVQQIINRINTPPVTAEAAPEPNAYSWVNITHTVARRAERYFNDPQPGARRIDTAYGRYPITATGAQRIWQMASALWHANTTGPTTVPRMRVRDNRVVIRPTQIEVGCQSVPRSHVEWLARRMGWEPANA